MQRMAPRSVKENKMNKPGFFREHHEAASTHADVWVLSRILVASAAALTVIAVNAIL